MGTCGKNGKNRTAEGVVEISKNPTDTTRRNKMKDMGIKKKKHVAIRRIVILCILAVLVLTGTVFSHFVKITGSPVAPVRTLGSMIPDNWEALFRS